MDNNPAVALPPKTPSSSSSSSSIRFLGLLKQPESDSRPSLDELDERDVICPPHLKPDPFDPHSDPDTESEPDLSSPGTQHHRLYPCSGLGLSAVFAEDRGGLTIRRPTRSLTGRIGAGPDLLAKSAPLNVPTWRGRRRRPHFDDALDDVVEHDVDEDDDDDEGEMVPPHVIVARSHVTTFSVFEGVGRTLKGRDLRRVRNAVFQQTGFLD